MAQEHLKLIRTGIEEWNGGNVDGVVDRAHPDALLYPFPEWPDDPVYRGRDGWRKLLAQWLETFDEIIWEIDRLIEKDGKVIALVHQHAKIKGTGVPLVQPLGVIFQGFRDGLIGEIHFFLTWDEALRAAGAEEAAETNGT
jgi:hypothetical protein